jgi:hypothetical protein
MTGLALIGQGRVLSHDVSIARTVTPLVEAAVTHYRNWHASKKSEP